MDRKRPVTLTLALILLISGCRSRQSAGNNRTPDQYDSTNPPYTSEAPVGEKDDEQSEPEPAAPLHTTAEFSGKYSRPLVDDSATDPLEAARRYVENYTELPYVSNLEVKDAFFADELTQQYLEYWVLAEDSEIRKDYGWTDDMAERGIFKGVHVDYYANYDHTQTSFDMEGDCFINIYMVQYEDTGLWQEIDHDYRPAVRSDTV